MASALIVLRCASQPAAKMFCKSRVPRQVRARTAVGDKGAASSARHLWVMDSAVDLIFGAAMASGGTSIQTGVVLTKFFNMQFGIIQCTIRYTSTKYAYKHKLTKHTVHIAQIFLETCIHYNK